MRTSLHSRINELSSIQGESFRTGIPSGIITMLDRTAAGSSEGIESFQRVSTVRSDGGSASPQSRKSSESLKESNKKLHEYVDQVFKEQHSKSKYEKSVLDETLLEKIEEEPSENEHSFHHKCPSSRGTRLLFDTSQDESLLLRKRVRERSTSNPVINQGKRKR